MSLRVIPPAASIALLLASGPLPSAGAGPNQEEQPEVREAVRHDTSAPLRVIARQAPAPEAPRSDHAPLRREPPPSAAAAEPRSAPAETEDRSVGPKIPSPQLTFDGVANADNAALGQGTPIPPDTVGDIGPNHYVQMTNVVTEIFDRNGNSLTGPFTNNAFWSGLGGLCETTNEGDPIVLYDPLADRWLASQFAFDVSQDGDPVPPFHECVAVSATADPTGPYHRYDFLWGNDFNDYPKLGVWHDAYYLSVNEFFVPSFGYKGAAVAALDRDAMLSGDPASMIRFDGTSHSALQNSFTLLPSDVDGATPPPAGSPNFLVELRDGVFFPPPIGLNVWRFHVDFATPPNSTLTGPIVRSTAPYDIQFGCGNQGFANCIPQPGTPVRLDQLADRLMHRNAYRNFGTHQSLVLSHTVDVLDNGASGQSRAGVRWYELRNPGGNPPQLFQQGTFAPGGLSRWMPSAAMNEDGAIAVGYSASSGNLFPSIRYAGRHRESVPGTLTEGEATLFPGSGSQTDPLGRWGDYSAMSVDPVGEERFWYTNEYYPFTSARGWRTRIGAFGMGALPNCFGQTATIVGSSGPDTIRGTPGSDVIVSRAGGDTIKGRAGGDRICAGAGRDEANGGRGADRITGQGAADLLRGGGGPDVLVGAKGNDTLRGQRGNDTLRGGPGNDVLNGGPGFDTCRGGPGRDTLINCEN